MMNDKMDTKLNTTKKKTVGAAACIALVLAIGSSAVFAAGNAKKPESKAEKGNVAISEAGAISSLNTKGEGILVRDMNGEMSHSTDGGKTWSSGAPEGAKITKNGDGTDMVSVGTHTVHDGDLPKNGTGLAVRNLNGKMTYSTDGGKTWSEKAPAGFTASTSADGGKVSVKVAKDDVQ